MVKIVDGWIWENKSVAKRGSYVFSCPASLDMDEYFLCELFTKLEQVCATGLIHQLFSFSSHLFFFFFKEDSLRKNLMFCTSSPLMTKKINSHFCTRRPRYASLKWANLHS